MATASNPAVPPETRQLTADEGWDLIFSLFGSAKDLYAEYGGGEAWLKAERAPRRWNSFPSPLRSP
jgi:hypothetical protein